MQTDVSHLPTLFPDTPARRVSVSGKRDYVPRDLKKAKNANESDVSGYAPLWRLSATPRMARAPPVASLPRYKSSRTDILQIEESDVEE